MTDRPDYFMGGYNAFDPDEIPVSPYRFNSQADWGWQRGLAAAIEEHAASEAVNKEREQKAEIRAAITETVDVGNGVTSERLNLDCLVDFLHELKYGG